MTHRINKGSARVYRVCGKRTHEEAAMTRNDLRRKNERLRDEIAQVVEKVPELRGVTGRIGFETGPACGGRDPIPRTNRRQIARTSACDHRAPPRAKPLFRYLTSA